MRCNDTATASTLEDNAVEELGKSAKEQPFRRTNVSQSDELRISLVDVRPEVLELTIDERDHRY